MRPEDIKTTKTEPIIKNTLPNIFDKSKNNADFKYQFGKPIDQSTISLSLELEYIVSDYKDTIGALSYYTIYRIESIHPLYNNFQLFHVLTERDILEYENVFKNAAFINYPIGKIHVPTFEEILPILKEFFEISTANN